MTTVIHRWVEECRAGENPRCIARLNSGWAVMGSSQFLSGYSLILPDPVVADLNELTFAARKTLLHEMTILGDALLQVTNALRINYEILGNLEPALHVHVFPRFPDEPEKLKTSPVWFYDWDNAPQFSLAEHGALKSEIAAYLSKSGVVK